MMCIYNTYDVSEIFMYDIHFAKVEIREITYI